MPATIDYFLAPQSPWTYLGHARFMRIAAEAGATVRVLPVDLGGKIFPRCCSRSPARSAGSRSGRR